jgi:phosphoglycolate phosphatase
MTENATAAYAASTAIRADRYQRFFRTRLRAVRCVIVDLDGTMVDTAPDFHVAVSAMCNELDLDPWPLQAVTDCIGKGPENLVRQVLGATLAPSQVDAAMAGALLSYQRNYQRINGEHAQLYPNVVQGLEALHSAGLLLACVTNKPQAQATALLNKKGLAPYFRYVYGGDSLPFKKPHAYPILRVCSDFALLPDQALLIGDSSNDVQAAHAAGCISLCVPYGYNHGKPIEAAGADAIIPDLYAAAQLILS